MQQSAIVNRTQVRHFLRGGGLPLPLGSPVSENWFSAWPQPLGATTCESLEQPEVGSHNNGPPTSQVSLSLFWKLQSAVELKDSVQYRTREEDGAKEQGELMKERVGLFTSMYGRGLDLKQRQG